MREVRIGPQRRFRVSARLQAGERAAVQPAAGELDLLPAAAVPGRLAGSRSVSTVGRGNRPQRFDGGHCGSSGDRVQVFPPRTRKCGFAFTDGPFAVRWM